MKGKFTSYKEKLQSESWEALRLFVFQRDKYICQNCGKFGLNEAFTVVGSKKGSKYFEYDETFMIGKGKSIELNLHHVCYRNGREPWEYNIDELKTLCPECHKKVHEDTVIPIYDEIGNFLENTHTCDRCGGYGYIPKYSHIQSGICFNCWGEGINLESLH
jgi:5-methylcytosine-specific restriction endonuclease McrA